MKKRILISTIAIFLLCCLTHFVYDWIPNDFFAIFFPVNESKWEHMKMMYTSILLFEFARAFYQIKHQQEISIFAAWSSALCSIPIYLLMDFPFDYFMGHVMIVSFILLFFTLFLTQWIREKMIRKESSFLFYFTIIGIILSYIGLGYLTYHPLHTDLFFDEKTKIYGLLDYYMDSIRMIGMKTFKLID